MDKGKEENQSSWTAQSHLGLGKHSYTPRGSLKTSPSQQSPLSNKPQWRIRCVEKRDRSSEASVFRSGLLQFLDLCGHAEQTLFHNLLLCGEWLTDQSHPLNMSLSKAGNRWLSHGSAQLWLQDRCVILLLKMTLYTLLGFYANNFEENGS